MSTAGSVRPGSGAYSPDRHQQTQRPPRDTSGDGGRPGMRRKGKIADEFEAFIQASLGDARIGQG